MSSNLLYQKGKILPFNGDLVSIEGTNVVGVVTADVWNQEPHPGERRYRVIWKSGRKWLRQWIPESALTVVTKAYEVPDGFAFERPREPVDLSVFEAKSETVGQEVSLS